MASASRTPSGSASMTAAAMTPMIRLQRAKPVPIVFILVAEPVDQGFVQSLSHPGENITGFAYLERTIGAKWLALLAEIAPRVRRVAYVFSPKAGPYAHFYYETAQAAAAKMGLQLDIDPVNEPTEIEPILAKLGPEGGAVFSVKNPVPNSKRAGLRGDRAADGRVQASQSRVCGAQTT